MVNDNAVIDKVTLDDYLIKDFIPYVTSFYDTSVKAHTSLDEIFQIFIQAINKSNLDRNQVYDMLQSSLGNIVAETFVILDVSSNVFMLAHLVVEKLLRKQICFPGSENVSYQIHKHFMFLN
jgi:uncharacterized NAD(P)/FAD-binding protein YdhS